MGIFARFAENGGRARWITSPILYQADWEAIVRGALRSEEFLEDILSTQIDDIKKFLNEDTLTAISWMVADEILTFRIALPTALLDGGDFHDKFGVFRDELETENLLSGVLQRQHKGVSQLRVHQSFESPGSNL